MTYAELSKRFTEACTACELGGNIVRDGNWEPVARALRHFTTDGSAELELVAEHGGTAILKVTPAGVSKDALKPGKSALNRPAFLLLLK